MIVSADVHGCIIQIKVGDGHQTFKWLAAIIQSRIAEQKLLRPQQMSDHVIVKTIRNKAGELVNPNDLIVEHRPKGSIDTDTLNVFVEVMTEFESDEHGFPIYDDWLQAAYMITDTSSKWALDSQMWRDAEKLRIEHEKEYAEYDDDVDGHDVLARLTLAKRKATYHRAEGKDDDVLGGDLLSAGSSLVQIGYDFTPAEISAAFSLDWCHMKFAWLKNLTETTKIAIHDALKSYYSVVCNLFVHYCGMGKIGERWGMSIGEFEHVMVLATGRKKLIVQILVDKTYTAMTGKKAGRSLKKAMAEAAAAQKRADEEQKGEDDDDENDHQSIHTMGQPKLSKRSLTTSKSTLKSNNTTSTSVFDDYDGDVDVSFYPLLSRQMFAEYIVCYAYMEVQDQSIGDIGLALAHNTEVLLKGPLRTLLSSMHSTYLKYTEYDAFTVNETYAMLKEFFLKNASMDPYLGPHMTVKEFETLMLSSQMLIEADNDYLKERQFSEQAFGWALMNEPKPVEEEPKATVGYPTGIDGLQSSFMDNHPQIHHRYDQTNDHHNDGGKLGIHDTISFSEFVEAVSKLSLITMENVKAFTELKKIRVGLNFLIEYYVTGSFDGLGGSEGKPIKKTSNVAATKPTKRLSHGTGEDGVNSGGSIHSVVSKPSEDLSPGPGLKNISVSLRK